MCKPFPYCSDVIKILPNSLCVTSSLFFLLLLLKCFSVFQCLRECVSVAALLLLLIWPSTPNMSTKTAFDTHQAALTHIRRFAASLAKHCIYQHQRTVEAIKTCFVLVVYSVLYLIVCRRRYSTKRLFHYILIIFFPFYIICVWFCRFLFYRVDIVLSIFFWWIVIKRR